LKELAPLKKLAVLHAKGNGITNEGLADLRKEVPSLALVSPAPSSGIPPKAPPGNPIFELAPPVKAAGPLLEEDAKALLAQDLKNIEISLTIGNKTGAANKNKASRSIKSNAMMIAFYANSRIGVNPADDLKLATLRDAAVNAAIAAGRKNFNIGGQIKQLKFGMDPARGVNAKALTTAGLVEAGKIDIEELMYQFKKSAVGGLGIEQEVKANANTNNLKLSPSEAIILARRVLAVSEMCNEVNPGFDAKKTRVAWQGFNKNLNNAAQGLIATAKSDPKKLPAAFAKLDAACIACHEHFK